MIPSELASALRALPHDALFEPALSNHIRRLELAGSHVTLIEVLSDGALLVLVHNGPLPSADHIREALSVHLHRKANGALQ